MVKEFSMEKIMYSVIAKCPDCKEKKPFAQSIKKHSWLYSFVFNKLQIEKIYTCKGCGKKLRSLK